MNETKLTNGQITKYSMMGLTQFMAMMPAFMYYRTFLQVNLKVPAELLAVLVLIGTGVDFLLSLVAGPVVEKSSGGNGANSVSSLPPSPGSCLSAPL